MSSSPLFLISLKLFYRNSMWFCSFVLPISHSLSRSFWTKIKWKRNQYEINENLFQSHVNFCNKCAFSHPWIVYYVHIKSFQAIERERPRRIPLFFVVVSNRIFQHEKFSFFLRKNAQNKSRKLDEGKRMVNVMDIWFSKLMKETKHMNEYTNVFPFNSIEWKQKSVHLRQKGSRYLSASFSVKSTRREKNSAFQVKSSSNEDICLSIEFNLQNADLGPDRHLACLIEYLGKKTTKPFWFSLKFEE